MKRSEAKIIIFLEAADIQLCFARHISNKLKMDYGYLLRQLNLLKEKKWITIATRKDNKVFYRLTSIAPHEQAKKLL